MLSQNSFFTNIIKEKIIISVMKYYLTLNIILINLYLVSGFIPNFITSSRDFDLSEEATKYISTALAGADHTGHNVLHTNSQIIHLILDSNLSTELKKDLSLFCIKFAQFGDHTGHNILSCYHHFVDKFL